MKKEEKKYEIGVMVGRFQVHELHEAHRNLIDSVIAKHKKVILFLGVAPKTSEVNPLDFDSRRKMIQADYPNLVILALPDQRSDKKWSAELDRRVKEIYPIGSVLLYGGRDSFIPYYHGVHDTHQLDEGQEIFISGTEVRKLVSEEVKASSDFRAGVIYNAYNQYPKVYATVDVACLKENKILLARKPNEDQYRFVGGFTDPKDTNFEHSAKREFMEETGGNCNIEDVKYVGSFKVDDWRYRKGRDKIITILFKAQYQYGSIQPSDDISELRWFDIQDLLIEGAIIKYVVKEHVPLMIALLSDIGAFKTTDLRDHLLDIAATC